MGGVPLLLKLIAMMGITYGWQPDNNGGVEYIIQVSPDDVRELERLGEISSAIDPLVQGHVSRVVVRVGNAPLPRTTPPNLAQRKSPGNTEFAASDLSAVPIPEMDDTVNATPIPGLQPTQAAVMKPQSEGGFSLPASLRGAEQGVDNAASRVGQELLQQGAEKFSQAAGQAGNALRDAAADILNKGQQQTPSFTGVDPTGEYARARLNGPSTAPVSRDDSWREFAGAKAGGPTTNPINSLNARGASVTGVGPRDTFGTTPAGINFPNANVSPNTNALDAGISQTGVLSQAEQIELDRQQRLNAYQRTLNTNQQVTSNTRTAYQGADRLTAAEIAAGAVALDTYGRPVNKYNQLVTLPDPNMAAAAARTTSPFSNPTVLGAPNPQNQQFDSQSELQYANQLEVQRQAQLAQQNLYPNSLDPRLNPNLQDPRLRYPNQTLNQVDNSLLTNSQMPNSQIHSQTAARGSDLTRVSPVGQQTNTRIERDPPSLGDRNVTPPRQVAAQPLFNGLLLISFVANIYLIFWLKNLRLQFRDLVTAKRVANTTNPVS
jgi:hypothetical protein